MVVIPMSTFEKPSQDVLLRIQRAGEWKVEARMPEKEARNLASECRKRGLTASVEVGHG